MKKEFVPFELAVKLKELGFDEPCFGYYVDGELRGINLGIEELGGIEPYYQTFGFHTLSNHNIDNPNKIVVTAPTYSQAFRWFREKYGLVIEPCVPFQRLYSTEEDHFEILEFGYRIYSFDQFRGGLRDKIEWDGYDNSNEEEAELACLQKLIEIIESKSE